MEPQNDIDNIYKNFETVLTNEIELVLEPRTIKVSWGPWRNDQSSEQWNKTCYTEKIWLGGTTQGKKKHRITFLNLRKQFDKNVQKAKRQFRK